MLDSVLYWVIWVCYMWPCWLLLWIIHTLYVGIRDIISPPMQDGRFTPFIDRLYPPSPAVETAPAKTVGRTKKGRSAAVVSHYSKDYELPKLPFS